jgi:alpha,alpha-trehalose phosphorylase
MVRSVNISVMLSMSDSMLERGFIWTYAPGRRLMISSKRLVSQTRQSLAASTYKVFPLDADVELEIKSCIDGLVSNRHSGDDPRVGSGLKGRALVNDCPVVDVKAMLISLQQHTRRSGMRACCTVRHSLSLDGQRMSIDLQNDDLTVSSENSADRLIFRLGLE